ncbi:MAG: hypothetical protein Q7T01_04085 [bacterium]|nr:hypothetical protein [bacterium]
MATLYCYGCAPEHVAALQSIAQRMRYTIVDLPALSAIPAEMDDPACFAVPFSTIFDLLQCLKQHPSATGMKVLTLLPAGFRRDVQSESIDGYTVIYLPEDLLGDAQRAFAELPMQ